MNKPIKHQPSYESIVEMYQLREAASQLKREPSLEETKQIYHPPGYYLFFCIHNKHNFTPCNACGRTQADGDIAREVFLRKYR